VNAPSAAGQVRDLSKGQLGRPWGRRYLSREVIPPLVLGAITAWLIIGWDGVDPTNIGWNSQGDSATHYLGWWFFRNAPWHFPLGKNLDYGLELGSSVFYSDSIPLFAFLFKALARWLSTPFQYFGIWVAVCLMLQAFFAWRVLGTQPETRGLALRLSAVGLFLFSPPLMIRIGGHNALVGHWLILAALSFYLTPHPGVRRYAWPALVLAATLVHSYLLVMVLGLWCADLIRRLQRRVLPTVALDVALVLGVAVVGLWQAGFFLVRVEPEDGYGSFGMNLLAPFNPDIYSRVLPPVAPPLVGFHEGYNFAGLGCLLLIPALLVPVALRRPGLWRGVRRHWPLASILLALTAFAVTQHVGVGMWSFSVPLPEGMLRVASTLRSSGRMFWPVHYALLAAVVLLLARGYGARLACLLLALATGVQMFDTSPGWWNHLHTHFHSTRASIWRTPLKEQFWAVAGDEYRILRRVPLVNSAPDYAVFGYYAASHHMATNAAYLARIDAAALERAQADLTEVFRSGEFEPNTLYVLDTAHAAQAAQTMDPGADFLVRVDGYFVLAPGWQGREHPPFVTPTKLSLRDIEPGLVLGREVAFGAQGDGLAYLGAGWSQPEAWGVWSEGPRAELSVPLDARPIEPLSLSLEVGAFVPRDHGKQRIQCWINGVLADVWEFTAEAGTGWRQVPVPAPAMELARSTLQLSVRFEIGVPGSPKSQGLGQDSRALGVALNHLKLSSTERRSTR
jgi:hypothetical protein